MADDLQAPTIDPQAYLINLRADQAELEQQINTLESGERRVREDIDYLEKKKTALEAKINFLQQEDILLADANAFTARIVARLNEVGANGLLEGEFTQANRTVSSVLGLPTLEEEKTILEEVVEESLAPKPGRKTLAAKMESFLFPDRPPLSVYEQHKQLLDPVSFPDITFWDRFANVCNAERSICVQVLPKYKGKLSEVVVGIGSVPLTSSAPLRNRLKELQKRLDETRGQKSKIDSVFHRWNDIYRQRKRQLQGKVSEEEADQMAREQANREIYEGTQTENTPVAVAEPLTRIAPEVNEAQAPTRPVAQSRFQPTGAENWRTVWAGWAKDPFGKLRALFTSGRKAAPVTAGVATGAKAAATGTMVKAGAALALPTGVTQAIGIAMLAKGVLGKMFDPDFWERVKNGAVFAGLQLYLWFMGLMTNILAGSAGIAGAVAGMVIGAKAGFAIGLAAGPIGGFFGGVIGGALGAVGGWFVGYGLGNIASGILGIGGTASTAATATAAATGMGIGSAGIAGVAPTAVPAAAGTLSVGSFTISSASSSLAALLIGTKIASIALISIGGSLLLLIFSITATLAAVFQEEPPPEPPMQEALFTLASKTDPAILGNDSDSSVTYSVTVIAGSEKDIEVAINTTAVLQKNGSRTNLADPQAEGPESFTLAKGQSQTLSYRPYPIPESYNDTRLVFTATVTANVAGESGQDVQASSGATKIGSPPEDTNQPFGFPAAGRIVRFEDDPSHRGTFFNSNGGRYWVDGGLDIVGPGGTPVYSTVNGQVIYSGFDLGDEKHNCSNAVEPVPPMKKCAVGGAVIVRSGDYIVSFLHLRQNGLATGQVAKGQIIGYFYDTALPTSTTPHVHYQVLLNGANVPFGVVANASDAPCTSQKILPSPAARQMVVTQDGSGPFNCQ